MSRYSPQNFDIKQPLFVRRPFNGNGRMWLPGMLFDWQHYAIAAHRVRALFRARYLKHEDPEELEVAPQEIDPLPVLDPKVVPEPEPTPTPVPEPEPEVAPVHIPAPEPTDITYSVVHAGGPYWNVVGSDGVKKNEKGLKKPEAETMAGELNSDENRDMSG